LRVNERIRTSQIRVIGEDGSQLGVMAPADALRLAREQGFDLVEVSPQTSPPVCRIMDFNKFRYEEERREREAKRKHHVIKLKEVKFKPRIGEHDYQVKLGRLKRFLIRGDQTKVTMVYRGREMTHLEFGRRVLERLVEDLSSVSKVERTPSMDGRFLTMIVGPDREKIKRLQRQMAAASKSPARAATRQLPEPPASASAKGGSGGRTQSTSGGAS
jgi:translation initiation factor IF-3